MLIKIKFHNSTQDVSLVCLSSFVLNQIFNFAIFDFNRHISESPVHIATYIFAAWFDIINSASSLYFTF
jgi:hypothetical protein